MCPLLALGAFLLSTTASASGFPPFPVDDSATVTRGGSVSVLDSGEVSVLANDFDFEGDQLFAFLEDDVDDGTLFLNPDGTFLYIHDGDKGKDDRFRYRAFDGTRFSRSVDVRITILDDAGPPRITGQDKIETDEDEARLIALQDLVIEGGSGDLDLWVGEGENYSVTGLTVDPAENFAGTLDVPVRVTDDEGVDSNTFVLDVVVRPVNDPPFVIGEVPDQVAREGELFELALAQSFGDVDSGDRLEFSATGLPPSRSLSVDRSTGVLSGTPQLADAVDLPFQVTITAEDNGRAQASLSFQLTIFPKDQADLELSLSAQPNPATFGNTPLWEIKVENLGPATLGEGTLTATWFSSEGSINVSPIGTGCDLSGDGTQQPVVVCPLGGLPALASNSFLFQSAHQVPGDTHLTASVTNEDPNPDNNDAALSLHLAGSFSEGPAQNLAVSASDVASADLNGDGSLDLIVAAEDLQVFFNTGARTLATPGLTLGPGGEGSLVTLIDWNLDGLNDVAIAHPDTRVAEIYLNDSGSFLQSVPLLVTDVRAMVGADLDGDGQEELVVSSSAGTEQIRNDGQGEPRITFVHPAVARDISTGDLDLDGRSDLLLTDGQTRSIHVLLNDGDGSSFSETTLEAGSVASVNIDDIDGDGGADLLVAIDGEDLEIPASRVLRNQLDGTFAEWLQVGASPTTELFSGDVTGDDIVDLVTINETGVHQVYVGDSLGGFALDEQQILSLSTPRGHLVDINDDSSLDLILAGRAAESVSIHANNGRGRFGLGDRTAPLVALLGEASMKINVGSAFVDPGATATDDIDGDISAQIVVDNPVDSSLVGTYFVTYAVTDRAGNLGQVARTVQVGVVAEGGGGGGAAGAFLIASLLGLIAGRRRHSRKG